MTELSGAQDLGQTVARLRRTFTEGVTRPLSWRLTQLRQIQRMIVEREDAWQQAMKADLGKCALETHLTETGFLLAELRHTIANLPDWVRREKVSTPLLVFPASSYVERQPLGVALIIGPWNYPLHLSLAPMIAAIAAGNCVVVKPSEHAPVTSAAIAAILPDYVDQRAVAVVEGDYKVAGALLNERFDHIFFTGGTAIGRIVMTAAAKHLTPVVLELGGKCPCIVDASADIDLAARRITWGRFLNCGQTCIAPDYVLAHPAIEDALIDRIVHYVRKFYGDDPQQSPDYARIINGNHHDRLTGLIEGQNVVIGGKSDRDQRYIAPTILRDVDPESPVMQEEIFGPILPVLQIADVDAAIDFVNARPRPLGLYLFTGSRSQAERVITQTTSGGAAINDVIAQIGVPELPFGGVGDSGMGGYHGRHGFECFSHRKGVVDKSTHLDVAIRYPPYANKLRWLRKLQ